MAEPSHTGPAGGTAQPAPVDRAVTPAVGLCGSLLKPRCVEIYLEGAEADFHSLVAFECHGQPDLTVEDKGFFTLATYPTLVQVPQREDSNPSPARTVTVTPFAANPTKSLSMMLPPPVFRDQ